MEGTAEPSYRVVKHQCAVALRLITAKRPLRTMRNKRTMRGYFWLPQRPMEAGSVHPLLIIVPISPLFHEGAQNLRATPPCAVLILSSDFDPQAGEINTMGRILRR